MPRRVKTGRGRKAAGHPRLAHGAPLNTARVMKSLKGTAKAAGEQGGDNGRDGTSPLALTPEGA